MAVFASEDDAAGARLDTIKPPVPRPAKFKFVPAPYPALFVALEVEDVAYVTGRSYGLNSDTLVVLSVLA